MIIKKLRFKNIKSYGNKTQELTFDNNGGLILLKGANGSGKTSILNAIDISLFNQSRGKTSSKIPLKNFPNRINNNLETGIEFYNLKNDYIDIKRCILPNDFNIKVNNQEYTENFKLLNDTEKEKLIGFNYQTFKSFISISMDDFNNFISLDSEDKRNLINRLFNLEEIDNYLSITKELINQNKKEIQRSSNDILTIGSELKDYMKIIKENKVDNNDYESKEDIKKDISDIKIKFNNKQTEIKDIKEKISNFNVNIQENRNKISAIETENIKRRTELNEIKNKIKIYDSGECPYCDSKLKTHNHQKMLEKLRNQEAELSEKINDNNSLISSYKNNNNLVVSQSKILENSLIELEDEFIDIKSDAKSLKDKYDNFNDDNIKLINDIKNKGANLLKKKKEKEDKINGLKKDNESLLKLSEILDDDGVRKNIMSSLVKPINDNLKKLLKYINFPYIVNLNNNFDADIYDRGDLIHSEISSNGEVRMLNICIAISYLQMIRKNKNINVLFMDEIFQSVEKRNINLLLDLLKDFAIKNEINLILVHHGLEEVDSNFFKKIISVQKDVFSDLKFE